MHHAIEGGRRVTVTSANDKRRGPALPTDAPLKTFATARSTAWLGARASRTSMQYAAMGGAWSSPVDVGERIGSPVRCATKDATWIAHDRGPTVVVALTEKGHLRLSEARVESIACEGEHAALIGPAEIVRCTSRECAPPIYTVALAAALADDGRLVVAREDVGGIAIEVYDGTTPHRIALVQPPGAARLWVGTRGEEMTVLVGNDDGALWIARSTIR